MSKTNTAATPTMSRNSLKDNLKPVDWASQVWQGLDCSGARFESVRIFSFDFLQSQVQVTQADLAMLNNIKENVTMEQVGQEYWIVTPMEVEW